MDKITDDDVLVDTQYLKDSPVEWTDYKKVSTATKKFEENDGISQTVQSDWIPIGEQVKMIMRGEITVGNLSEGFDDSFTDLDEESPEEVFEDATDYGTQYSDELREAVLQSSEQNKANDSADTKASNEKHDVEAPLEATTE